MDLQKEFQRIGNMREWWVADFDLMEKRYRELLLLYPNHEWIQVWLQKMLLEKQQTRNLSLTHESMSRFMGDIYVPESSQISIIDIEAQFLYDFLKDKNIQLSLEVWMWYGVSALSIMRATHQKHYIIDPFQKDFNNGWIDNLKKKSMWNRVVFLEQLSCHALPELVKQEIKIEFAFIDGSHKFDDIFLDFYYIDMLLPEWWYVCFHDHLLPSTQHVSSWIQNNKTNYIKQNIPYNNMLLFQKNWTDLRWWKHFENFIVPQEIF